MRRKSLLLTLACLFVLLAALSATAFILLKHQPTFYRNSVIAEGKARIAQSAEFESRFWSLTNSIQDPDWWEVFTTEQVNSYLQEDFIRLHGGDNNLPEGFHDLRVQLEENKIRLGCRYGTGFWSSTLSIDVKMWLVAHEVNTVALEIVSLRFGAFPVSRQIILDRITEAAHRWNIGVAWYHRNGNPVAILKLQANVDRPTFQLQRFELQPGKMIIVGRSTGGSVGRPSIKADR